MLSDLNFSFFSKDSEYNEWVVWTTFIILLRCFLAALVTIHFYLMEDDHVSIRHLLKVIQVLNEWVNDDRMPFLYLILNKFYISVCRPQIMVFKRKLPTGHANSFSPSKTIQNNYSKVVDFIVFNKKTWLGESLINKGLKSVGRGGNRVFKGYLFFHLGYPPKKLVN